MNEVNYLKNTLYNLFDKIQYKEARYNITPYKLESLKYNICNYLKNILNEDFIMYELNGKTYIGVGQAIEFKITSKNFTIERKESNLKINKEFKSLSNLLQEIYSIFESNKISAFGNINFNLAKYLHLSNYCNENDELLHFFVPSTKVEIREGEMLVQFLESNPFSKLSEIYEEIEMIHVPLKSNPERILLNQQSESYKKNVSKAISDINNGKYSKVIISRKINISESINMIKSYFLGLKFNNPVRSYLYSVNEKELFGFSPETIVQVDNYNKVLTFPLAGTRKNEESLKKELLTDIKEVGEHAVSVNLALKELGDVCIPNSIIVEEFMNIYERGSVQHLGSKVSGILKNKNYWDALLVLYPAVTASGIPKKESIEAIEKYEDMPRNLYSGGIFIIDKEIGFDVALILRTVFQDKDETYLRAGAGIVEKSNPDREMEETREKLKSVIESLSL